ncbi:hypothetical protein CPLU01_15320 [Colletotrichum plurivorum]|uniref:Uncharacterized protein n=1 Tax=Colletotrichum plurivorum TaxID=2175906 RepID=A0A8H6MW61_9PEZI|nr:hypothetical protein CPLU01_15320 [Colletotrichum plurivorum]
MTTLLTLPREIRDEILGHRRQRATPRPSGLGLLLASLQLRSGALPLLERHDANPELDVMYVKNCGFWPTWTRTPLRPGRTRFDTVHVRFRIFDAPSRPPPKSPRDWCSDKVLFGPRIPISAAFFAMLRAFLQKGTRFAGPVGVVNDGAFAAETLVLDVLVSEEPGAHRILGPMITASATWPARWPKPAELREDRVPSEKLTYFLWTRLHAALLSRLDDRLIPQLCSGFGSIEIKVDGEARTASHLSRWLALPDTVYQCPEDYGPEEDSDDEEDKEWADLQLERRLECAVQPARERRAQRGLGQKGGSGTEKVLGDYDADGADDYLDFEVQDRSDLNGTLEQGGVLNP